MKIDVLDGCTLAAAAERHGPAGEFGHSFDGVEL
jgi:hypothetical protein